MNNIFIKTALVLLSIAAITSCTKESSDEFVTYTNNPINDTVWANSDNNNASLYKIIIPQLITPTVVDSFNCLVDNTLTFGDSLQVFFGASSCTNGNGTTITSGGKIKIEINLLKQKGDFIKYGLSTTNVFSLLEAGNLIDIKLSQDGQEIFLHPNSQIKVKIKDSIFNNNMKFFAGSFIKYNKDTVFAWLPSVDGKVSIWKDNTVANKSLGYEIATNKLRWIGTAYYTDSLQAKTRLNVTLPLNYTNKNTAVFAVFKNKKTVINLLGDASTKTFYTLNIPVNTEVTLVSVTKIENNFYLGTKAVKVINGDAFSLLPEKKTTAQIAEFLEKL